MNRSSRFFRQVWRVNALLILVATAAATFGVGVLVWSEIESSMRRRSSEAATPPVPGKQESSELRLGALSPVEGTTLYRAALAASGRSGSKYSSGGGDSETRNILVVDSTTATSRWYLPTDKELIVYNQDVAAPQAADGSTPPPVATVILVKEHSADGEAEDGRILVSDLSATDVRELANGVRVVYGASLTTAGQIAIMFEQNRNFHIAIVDAGNRRMLSDRVVAVPALK